MFATFSCASAASGMFGKKVMKSLYSISACCSAAVPPSAYQESPTASLARAMNSESGYVLISVCSVMRATSYLPFFIASIARSNNTLSGCLESTFAIGLLTLLWWQPATSTTKIKPTMNFVMRRIMNSLSRQLSKLLLLQVVSFPVLRSALLLIDCAHWQRCRAHQRRRCRQPAVPHRLSLHHPLFPDLRHRQPRCGNSVRAPAEFSPVLRSCAARRE